VEAKVGGRSKELGREQRLETGARSWGGAEVGGGSKKLGL
jgi:hypothetical protein